MKSVNPNKWTIVFLNTTDDANICTLDSVGSIFVGIIDCIDRQETLRRHPLVREFRCDRHHLEHRSISKPEHFIIFKNVLAK